jgi:hypothetical protein
MACYDDIIGLSRTTCPCADPKPTGYNTSKSGLFLDELEPLNALDGWSECAEGSVWDLLARAREESVHAFIADSNALLLRSHKWRREPWAGTIGEATGRDVLTTGNIYAGLRIQCAPVRSGTLRIRAIGALFTATGTVQVKIYNGINQLLATIDLNTVAGSHTVNTLPTPIELPLSIPYSPATEYFLTYTVNPANLPKTNNVSCGCGGFNPVFSTERPVWTGSYSGSQGWANWMQVGGWEGDTLTDFDQAPAYAAGRLNGLTLDIQTVCDVSQVLCHDELDYLNNPLAMSMAFAVRYKAAERMADRLLLSTNLNRAQMVNREALTDARREWISKYNEHVAYIASHADVAGNDCLTCKSAFNMSMTHILT